MRRNNAQSDLVAARSRVVAARQQHAAHDGARALRRRGQRPQGLGRRHRRQVGKELLKVIDPSSMRFEGLVSADRMLEIRSPARRWPSA
jgi:membrane fusion protein (multidrug efflux system)